MPSHQRPVDVQPGLVTRGWQAHRVDRQPGPRVVGELPHGGVQAGRDGSGQLCGGVLRGLPAVLEPARHRLLGVSDHRDPFPDGVGVARQCRRGGVQGVGRDVRARPVL